MLVLNTFQRALSALYSSKRYTVKHTCRSGMKGVAAKLSAFWCQRTLTFVLKQLEANISLCILLIPVMVVVIILAFTIQQNIALRQLMG